MKLFSIIFLMHTTLLLLGQAQKFDPVDFTQNATFQTNFLAAIGETPDYCIDFESSTLRNNPVGPTYKNLNNVSGLFPNGVKLTETDGNLWVAQGKGMTWEDVNADNDNDLGEGPAYNGLWSLSNYEQESTTIDFGTNPVDYVSFYFGDWDVAGKTESTMDCSITITFADNSTTVIATDRTASSKYEFWGYYTGVGGKKIKKVTLKCYNNDSQWGLDDICYGVKGATCNLSVSASNSGPFCTGSTIGLNSLVTGSSGTISYTWIGPSSFTSSSPNPMISNATTAMAGTYSVTVSNNGCTATGSTTVAVNATPNASAANGGPYCVGQTINLTSTGGGTYSWSGPAGFTSTSQNPNRTNAITTMAGIYTVTVTNGSCSNIKTTNVIVNQTMATATSNSPICTDSTLYLSSSGGGTYSWSGPAGFTSTSQNPSRSPYTSVMAGIYTVTVTKNSCTSTATVTVSTSPSCISCSIKGNGLKNISCDNNNTLIDSNDDFIKLTLKPWGSGLGANYTVSVSTGSITPTSGSYSSDTNFTLNSGSAGGGDITVTITDNGNSNCKFIFILLDPGNCSNCPPYTCTNPSLIKN